jgi:hypothetical protein
VDPVAESEPRALWCATLLERLRLEGFDIGIGQVLSIERLLDRIGPECTSAELRTILSPIVARNPEEQRRFYEVFTEYLAASAMLSADESTEPQPAVQPIDHRQPKTRIAPVPVIPWWQRRGTQLAGILVVVAFAAFGLEQLRQSFGPIGGGGVDSTPVTPPPLPPPQSPAPLAGVEPGVVKPLDIFRPRPTAVARNWRLVRYGAAALPLLALGWFAWRRRRRQDVVAEREARADAPYVWPIRIPAATTDLYPVSDAATSSRVLRRRQEGAEVRLSVERTIRATIQAAGFPSIRYEPLTRPSEYLALIQRASRRDHQAMFFDDLVRRLAADGVFITQYFFEHDPRVCFSTESARAVRIADLARQREGDRLLVFSDGYSFLHPLNGTPLPWLELLEGWADRALLTPVPPRQWGRREAVLRPWFSILPATLEGIRAAADHFEIRTRPDLSRWKERDRSPAQPRVGPVSDVGELRKALGDDLFRWMAACAAYPELHWDLTALLGGLSEVGTGVLAERNVLRMVRLPWFRDGRMSAEFQNALLQELEEMDRASGVDTLRAVRQTIVKVLEQEQVDPQSVAGLARKRELLRQHLYLYLEKPAVAQRTIDQLEKEMPADQMLQDVTVVRAVERAAEHRRAFRLPEWFRRWLWRGGIPGLGLTPLAAAGVALLVSALALALIPVGPTPRALAMRATIYPDIVAIAGPPGERIPLAAALIEPGDTSQAEWISSDSAVAKVASGSQGTEVDLVSKGSVVLRPGPGLAGPPIRVEVVTELPYPSDRLLVYASTSMVRSDRSMPARSVSVLDPRWVGSTVSCDDSVARVGGARVYTGAPGSTILVDGLGRTDPVGVRVIHVRDAVGNSGSIAGIGDDSLQRRIEEPLDRWPQDPTPPYDSAMRAKARDFVQLISRDSSARLRVTLYLVGERYVQKVTTSQADGDNPYVNRRISAMQELLGTNGVPSGRFEVRHHVSGLSCGTHSFGPAVKDGDLDRVFVEVIHPDAMLPLRRPLTLSVDTSTRILNAGDTTRIVLTVSGDRSGLGGDTIPRWSSSAEAVARVSETGVVRAGRPGRATVTVGLGSVRAQIRIFVNDAVARRDSSPVPELTGRSIPRAAELLRLAGLILGRVDSTGPTSCSLSPPGIIRSTPRAGAFVQRGSRVNVTWQQGREPTVLVPNLIGQSRRDAQALLTRSCLRLGAVDSAPVNPAAQVSPGAPGTIVRQSPAPGTTTKTGDNVRVTVLVGVRSAPDSSAAPSDLNFAARILRALLEQYEGPELRRAVAELEKGRSRLDLLREIANRPEASAGGRPDLIERVFRAVVCRPPSPFERESLVAEYGSRNVSVNELIDGVLALDAARRVRATCIGRESAATTP